MRTSELKLSVPVTDYRRTGTTRISDVAPRCLWNVLRRYFFT